MSFEVYDYRKDIRNLLVTPQRKTKVWISTGSNKFLTRLESFWHVWNAC